MNLTEKYLGEAVSFKTKAKKGDWIQSFNVAMPVATDRGSYIGKVYKIEKEGKGKENSGVEFVYYKAEFELENGIIKKIKKDLRAPQNGTSTMMGKITDGINVIGK